MSRESLDMADQCAVSMSLGLMSASRIRGEVSLQVLRRGRVIAEERGQNAVVTLGRQSVANMMALGSAGFVISHVGFGTSLEPTSPDMQELTGGLERALDSYSFPSPGQVSWAWTLPAGAAVGLEIAEFGLINGFGGLVARRVRSTALTMEPDMSLAGTWTLTF